jgi:hypothetical protein
MIWLWQTNLRAKELAYQAAKAFCQEENVQLLDESVIGYKYSFKGLRLIRHFRFDYDNGHNTRYHGYIELCGDSIISQKLSIYRENFAAGKPTTLSPGKVLSFPVHPDKNNKPQ